MMEFKSKTALIEHIKELVANDYLVESWIKFTDDDGNFRARKIFTLNTKAVKK